MIVLEQGSEADGASPQEARGSQARLRLQEATRGTGMDYPPSFQFLAPSGAQGVAVSVRPSVFPVQSSSIWLSQQSLSSALSQANSHFIGLTEPQILRLVLNIFFVFREPGWLRRRRSSLTLTRRRSRACTMSSRTSRSTSCRYTPSPHLSM